MLSSCLRVAAKTFCALTDDFLRCEIVQLPALFHNVILPVRELQMIVHREIDDADCDLARVSSRLQANFRQLAAVRNLLCSRVSALHTKQ